MTLKEASNRKTNTNTLGLSPTLAMSVKRVMVKLSGVYGISVDVFIFRLGLIAVILTFDPKIPVTS